MRHYFDFVPNATTGAAVPGALVRLFDANDTLVDIFADENGTAIETVSGIANAAKTDSDGMFSLYADNGIYTARFYVGEKVLKTIRNVELSEDVTHTALSATTGAALIGTSTGETAQAALDARVVHCAGRAALKGLSVTAHSVARVKESGKSGIFELREGTAPADPLEGIYVASNTAGFYWERDWDGIIGRPEWFYDSSGDWLAALNACLALCPATMLGHKDYPISDTWHIQTENRAVWGTSRFNRTAGSGPRIVLNHATKDVVMVGYAAQPSGAPEQDGVGAGFLKGVTLENFSIWRGVAPTPFAATNDFSSAGCGLRVQYVLKCLFRDLLVQDSTMGVYAGGTIYTKFLDVEARLDRPNTLGNYDTARAWVLDGTRTFGYSGGNASIFLDRCAGIAGRRTVGTADVDIPIGILIFGAYVDTFIDHFEVALTSKPMVLFSPAPYNEFAGTVDVHISHPILDQADSVGLEITNYGPTAAITIVDPYITSNGAATDGLLIFGGAGVTVLGGQVLGACSTAGLRVDSSGSYKVDGLRLLEQPNPVVVANSGAGEVKCYVTNRTVATGQAYSVSNTTRAKLTPITANTAGKISCGIRIDAASTRCTMDVTGVEDGPTDRIVRDGVGVPNQGNISTHFIINAGQPFTA